MRAILLLALILLIDNCAPPNPMPSIRQPIEKKQAKNDRPGLAVAQELEMTKNPRTGHPTPEKLLEIRKDLKKGLYKSVFRDNNPWEERGPNNVAGRSRAIMIDATDNTGNTVWAGSVSGGLWKTVNFRDDDATWSSQDDFFASLAIGAIAQKPSDPKIMFFGTGEGWFNGDAVRGLGIWRSMNGGQDWSQLPSTNNERFYYIQRIKITTTGTIYASTRTDGVQRSTDNGDTWTKVLGGGIGGSFSERAGAIELASDGKVYVGMGIFSTDGIYVSDDNGDTWDYLSDPSLNNGLPLDSFERVEIAVSPSDPAVIYSVFQKEEANTCRGIYRSDDSGVSWDSLPIPAAFDMDEFTRGQAWYDLTIAVDPENSAVVYLGGVDLLRSKDGGRSWTQISQWYGSGFPFVHADQHQIVFFPDDRYEGIVSNDGGVFNFKIDPELDLTGSPSYCVPVHIDCCNDQITKVTLNDLINDSTEPTSETIVGYSDFTAISTTLTAGSAYDLAVVTNRSWDDSKSGAWIDWDQNGDFTEDENIYSTSGMSPYGISFTVPEDASHGNTRMRIRLQFSPDYSPDPCESAYTLGETEDYSIFVSNCFLGNSCNDGDLCTQNDRLDENCNCKGTEITAEDGGCNLINDPAFTSKNNNLNITQFYSCAIHPEPDNNLMLAGSQDNGTQYFTDEGINSTFAITGGDGGFCFIDQDEPDIQITTYVYNVFWITPDGWTEDFEYIEVGESQGRFINPMDYDSESNTLFGAYREGFISRIRQVGSENLTDTVEIAGLEELTASAFKVDPLKENHVWVGSPEKLILLSDASSDQPTIEKTIELADIGASDYLRCIEVDRDDSDHLLIAFSNYGVDNIWESKDGGDSWQNVDGNLPDMPVRWIITHPNLAFGAVIATEMGVWQTEKIDGSKTVWEVLATGLGNVKCSMLKYRPSDKTLAVATHGRGLYTLSFCSDQAVQETLVICEGTTGSYRGRNFSEAGDYEFWISDPSTCSDSTLILLTVEVQESPVIFLSDSLTISNTEVIMLSADNSGSSYLWSTEETTSSISISGQDLGEGMHTFSVEVTNSNGCTTESVVIVTVSMPSSVIDQNVISMEVFPNPVSFEINFTATLESVHIFDAYGKKVIFKRNAMKMDVRDLPSGVYLINGYSKSKKYAGKFVKL